MHIGWALKILGWVTGANVKKLFTFVVKYWRECLIAVLLSVVLYQNRFETRFFFGAQTIPALEADLAIVKNNLDICVEGNKTLSDAIDANNDRIRQYEVLTEKLEREIADLQGDLADARAETEAAVNDILNDPTPKTCQKAMQYLRDGTEDLKW
jgi:hypothetical protein